MKFDFSKFIKVILLSAIFFAIAGRAEADHSWGGYHWERSANPFELKLGDNVFGVWDSVLNTASSDWSQSNILNTTVTPSSGNPKICKPIVGRIEVCNSKYGNNGWLGLAQIWITGGEHITQGVTKLNDTYFSKPQYNTIAWRNLVTCQEIGHTFGLDHQDEDFYNPNLGSCMDYASDPTTNQHPNVHDYSQLETIYTHLDFTITIPLSSVSSKDNSSSWGKAVAKDKSGKDSIFEKDLGNGKKVITHVFWAE